MIEVKSLTKRYKNGVKALNGVNLSMKAKTTAILGRNGAGKTTLLRILSTQLLPTGGSAKINGYDVVKDAETLRKNMISIPQEAGTIGVLTPYEHLELYMIARGMPHREIDTAIPKVLRELDLWDSRNRASDELSGGMKRKIFVAMALASRAEITFLDEPTLGLDPISRLEVWSTIKKLSGTIVLTTHYIDEARELAQDIVLVDSGRVVSHGTAERLLKSMSGKVRVESTEPGARAQYRIGGLAISYVKPREASKYVRKGFSAKQMGIEDLFITKGKRPLAITDNEGKPE